MAADFDAQTTHGRLKLEDFRGSWLILFSHPADFTPVCTTEFLAFAAIAEDLRQRDVFLLGLSVDSTYSHVAWVRTIKEKFGVDIPFPIIADLNKEVATAYGMIMPGESKTETSRAVFVIDPQGVVRAMIYYPLTTGRNMDEILRLIDALQTTDEHGVATPANWRKGDKVIVPPPATTDEAAAVCPTFTFEQQYNEMWEADEVPSAENMNRQLVAGHETLIRTARSLLPLASEAGDEVTADLVTQRLMVHEKTAWMLRSLLA